MTSGVVGVAVAGGASVGGDVHATVYVDARARRAAAVVRAVRPDPVADAGFVGRDHELAHLLDLLDPHPVPERSDSGPPAGGPAATTGLVVVSAVAGAPGVGKTALAQAAARAAAARGWFPGGALTVDLQGYDPNPAAVVYPAQLYAGLLRALGVPGEQVPPTEDEQATVYHQVLDQYAQAGRAVLLVLDNVGDPDQVAAVLPHGAGPHRVLITSRDSLAALPQARLLDLHVLDPAAAVELLATGLRRHHPTDTRTTTGPDAAARLVELCGWLPLAVQIVAALLGDEPDRSLSDLAGELADEGHRLRALDYDRRWAVRAAFDLSHHRLDPPTAELFALLGAVPGPDVGLAVAAAVADRDEHSVRAGLRALCRAHLLDQQPAQQSGQSGQRWRMHDLIRLYAAEHLTPDQHTAGFARLLTHYRHTADLARWRFSALRADQDQVPAGFATPQDAMAWVLQERAGLVACTLQAAATHPEDAVRLAADLAPFLRRARLLADWVTIASTAVQAADALDRGSAAGAWNNLGNALAGVRRFDEAIAAHQQARDLFRETGDRHGEGRAWNSLGNALAEVRRFEEAITAHRQAGDLFRETGDRHGEGGAWNSLGVTLREVRRFDEAITAHQQDLAICHEVGDRHGEGKAWNNLGIALAEVRRFDEATIAHQQAIDRYRETGDRHGEGGAWTSLGLALAGVRRFDEAITAHQQAIDLYRQVGDRHGEGGAWTNLGIALAEVRRFDEAITAHQQDLAICQEVRDRHREGGAWTNLGLALAEVGRFDEAITTYQQARGLYRETGDNYRHAQALENLAALHAELDHPKPALRAWAEAIERYAAAGAEDEAEELRQRLTKLGTPRRRRRKRTW